ncbi:MAG: glycosyltransferase [Taibaiella sp.]|nr:glycosyltransferase [Taibaiella sp.]
MEEFVHFFKRYDIWDKLGIFYEGLVFVYGISLLFVYAMLAILSLMGIRKYLRKDTYVDYNIIIESVLSPGISIIAPAFNEGVNIIANVRSLLTLYYPKFEVIIINDGSTDDTLDKLTAEFELIEVDYAYVERIVTQPVKRIFKSLNPAYDKLVVIDKENGRSKADASNAGINVSAFDYFLCTDVDCILDKDTLIRLIKPFLDEETSRVKENGDRCEECGYVHLEETHRKVIACGATLRMVNSCDVDTNLITRIRPPKKLLPRFQEMEYVRSYVVGKMGWDYINSVPNVSGGLGMFDKEIAINAGGYDAASFAEDMDLLTRMSAYMRINKRSYSVKYIPRTMCWTEGPTSLKVFSRQRTRWGRGMIQLISLHRKLIFNPRYGRLGMIVYPYNLLFEFLAPAIEFTGILYYIYIILTGKINWPFAIVLMIFVYTYSVMISTLALLWDQVTFRYYKTWREVIGLCLMAFIEPFIYHPLILFFALRGYFFFLTRRQLVWGSMQRREFGQQKDQGLNVVG